MTRRQPIDLATVRDARRKLAQIAREHPEAFDPGRLPTTPEALEQAMKRVGRPPSPDPTIAVPTRLPRSMMQALDELLEIRRQESPALTRQDLMREAVAHYLAAEFCARRRTITIVAQTVS
jgi:hypothetical protein